MLVLVLMLMMRYQVKGLRDWLRVVSFYLWSVSSCVCYRKQQIEEDGSRPDGFFTVCKTMSHDFGYHAWRSWWKDRPGKIDPSQTQAQSVKSISEKKLSQESRHKVAHEAHFSIRKRGSSQEMRGVQTRECSLPNRSLQAQHHQVKQWNSHKNKMLRNRTPQNRTTIPQKNFTVHTPLDVIATVYCEWNSLWTCHSKSRSFVTWPPC